VSGKANTWIFNCSTDDEQVSLDARSRSVAERRLREAGWSKTRDGWFCPRHAQELPDALHGAWFGNDGRGVIIRSLITGCEVRIRAIAAIPADEPGRFGVVRFEDETVPLTSGAPAEFGWGPYGRDDLGNEYEDLGGAHGMLGKVFEGEWDLANIPPPVAE
jgi:hypothetical protein